MIVLYEILFKITILNVLVVEMARSKDLQRGSDRRLDPNHQGPGETVKRSTIKAEIVTFEQCLHYLKWFSLNFLNFYTLFVTRFLLETIILRSLSLQRLLNCLILKKIIFRFRGARCPVMSAASRTRAPTSRRE